MKKSEFSNTTKSDYVSVSGMPRPSCSKCPEFDAARNLAYTDPILKQLWKNIFDETKI